MGTRSTEIEQALIAKIAPVMKIWKLQKMGIFFGRVRYSQNSNIVDKLPHRAGSLNTHYYISDGEIKGKKFKVRRKKVPKC